MPTYRVTIEGHTYTVEVPNPSERPVRALVDGQTFLVEVDADGVKPTSSTNSPAVAPAPPVAMPAQVSAPRPTPVEGPGSDIEAPLPGTIVAISVAVGDQVTHGQELCVLEAMKMNNPIRATQPGTVQEILVNVGDQVQHGSPLMVISEA
jgi:biotin carboxyl carrier protein